MSNFHAGGLIEGLILFFVYNNKEKQKIVSTPYSKSPQHLKR